MEEKEITTPHSSSHDPTAVAGFVLAYSFCFYLTFFFSIFLSVVQGYACKSAALSTTCFLQVSRSRAEYLASIVGQIAAMYHINLFYINLFEIISLYYLYKVRHHNLKPETGGDPILETYNQEKHLVACDEMTNSFWYRLFGI